MHRSPGHCPPGNVFHPGWASIRGAGNRPKFGTTDRLSSLLSTQVLLVTRSSRNLRPKGSEDDLSRRMSVMDPACLLQVNKGKCSANRRCVRNRLVLMSPRNKLRAQQAYFELVTNCALSS
jgi:hypothetical protein